MLERTFWMKGREPGRSGNSPGTKMSVNGKMDRNACYGASSVVNGMSTLSLRYVFGSTSGRVFCCGT